MLHTMPCSYQAGNQARTCCCIGLHKWLHGTTTDLQLQGFGLPCIQWSCSLTAATGVQLQGWSSTYPSPANNMLLYVVPIEAIWWGRLVWQLCQVAQRVKHLCVVELRLLLLLLLLLCCLLWLTAAWLRWWFVSQRPRNTQYVSFMELVHDNI